ncbi:LacI family DNA-binding transcriptional regulator [Phytoactinopolyspora halotolerans]|uniref:LacI family transcriptional regulator n=1 Tax=Phytoactinopolyspora halotolerans TaxID=1981512 RepID=A0A6L9S4X2_9ACTN|nr:LacI family DNA-binding transcriptional regulator [Phytoactinopolyspora halotolerans]NEE00206.1 LacI family transcriptional regulator [Phytoactinopolyspora halotolerans]
MPQDRQVTIITVANRAGVSKTTASDALRGSGRVSEETRRLVTDVAAELGYVPNGSARHLRRARTGTIGLHLPEVLPRSDYYMSFVFGAVQAAADHGYDVTLLTSGSGAGATAERRPRVDGLVLGDPLAADPVVEKLMSSQLPTVTCERYPGPGDPDGIVWSDHGAALRELLDHLAAVGTLRPALIVPGDESDWAASVHRTYRQWCTERGVVPLTRAVPFDANADATSTVARNLLTDEPGLDALIAAPTSAAATLLPVIREAGRRVGDDLLLASCVDGPAMRFADPAITAIDVQPREAGAACAELLFELLAGAVAPGVERLHPIELNIRESTRRRNAP